MSRRTNLTAAGGVLWRDAADGPEVLLVHRPDYDDWSLPKGKPEKGENPLQTAAREVAEETGLSFAIGPRLGRVVYELGERKKIVHYWSMRLECTCTRDPRAMDAEEVDEFAWLPVAKAKQVVSYDGDRRILSTFERIGTTPISLILIRHGRAGSRDRWDGDDNLRPVDAKGREQADAVGATVRLFDPARLYSAPPLRCLQTAAPLAVSTGLDTVQVAEISDDCWQADPDRAIGALRELATAGRRVAAVSQGKVMNAALEALLPDAKSVHKPRKGGMWVLGARDGEVATADYYPTLLAD